MSFLSDSIERFINELFETEEDGIVEFKRNKMAKEFNCAPSQINYVLQTRFSTSRGYLIESKRGGGGYIKVIKLSVDEDYREMIFESVGDSITKYRCDKLIDGLFEEKLIEADVMRLMKTVLGDSSLSKVEPDNRNYVRADIIKNMLTVLENRGD